MGLAGPRPSKVLAVCCHLDCKRSRYSNRTVKYSIKAVSMPCQLTPSGYDTADNESKDCEIVNCYS